LRIIASLWETKVIETHSAAFPPEADNQITNHHGLPSPGFARNQITTATQKIRIMPTDGVAIPREKTNSHAECPEPRIRGIATPSVGMSLIVSFETN